MANQGHQGEGASPLAQQHQYWVDTIRVVTIGLVVFYHAVAINGGPPTPFNQLLSLLRVPLFFSLSGFMLSGETLKASAPQLARKYWHALVIPYLALGAATWLLWVLKLNLVDHSAMSASRQLRALGGLLYGVSGPEHFMESNEPMWFLSCLVVVHSLYYGARRAVPDFRLRLLVAAATGFAGQLLVHAESWLPPWNLDLALVVMPFYALGQVARERHWLERLCERQLRSVLVAVLAGLGLVSVYLLSGPIDLNMRMLGHPLGLYVGGFSGFLFMVMSAIALPASKLLKRMARNNLTVLCVHIFILTCLMSVAHFLYREDYAALHVTAGFALVLALIALPLSSLVGEWLRRHLPWMVGGRRA